MGIRETMNRHPALTTGLMLPVFLIAAGIVVYMQMPEKPPKEQTKSYYSVDDGKTYFEDKIDKLTPFDKDGQEAVTAVIYRCGRGQPFVAYLERMEPEAAKKAAKMLKGGLTQATGPQYGMLRGTAMQRKHPGDEKWIGITEGDAYMDMAKVTCKGGETAEQVYPAIP